MTLAFARLREALGVSHLKGHYMKKNYHNEIVKALRVKLTKEQRHEELLLLAKAHERANERTQK